MPLCDRFLADEANWNSKLFYLWGHSYEFEANDNWQVISSFAKKMGGHKDVWYATNIEVVDYVNAYRSLIVSADGSTVYNPTAATLWLEENGALHRIAPGETLTV